MKRLLTLLLILLASALCAQERIETWHGKKILVFTPHPDDDTWGCGGTLALLAKNGNQVRIVIYTNDDKGSFDLEMTSERLARIRKAEEEDRKSTRLNSSHIQKSRMPSSA